MKAFSVVDSEITACHVEISVVLKKKKSITNSFERVIL